MPGDGGAPAGRGARARRPARARRRLVGRALHLARRRRRAGRGRLARRAPLRAAATSTRARAGSACSSPGSPSTTGDDPATRGGRRARCATRWPAPTTTSPSTAGRRGSRGRRPRRAARPATDELVEQAAALTRRIAATAPAAVRADDLVGGRAGVALGLLDLGRRLGRAGGARGGAGPGRAARGGRAPGRERPVVAARARRSPAASPACAGSGTAPPASPTRCSSSTRPAATRRWAPPRRPRRGLRARVAERAAQANWPDLRGLDRAGVAAGSLPAYSSFWCHGAVGIGLARLRAWELTGVAARPRRRRHRAAGRDASTRGRSSRARDPSLCHGVAGLAELFLYARRGPRPARAPRGRPPPRGDDRRRARAHAARGGAACSAAARRRGSWSGSPGLGCVLLRAALRRAAARPPACSASPPGATIGHDRGVRARCRA